VCRIELQGDYPDTRILVEWRDEVSGRCLSNEWPLWDRQLFGSTLEQRDPPHFVATVVWANVDEA
jgi:hypothetical protein